MKKLAIALAATAAFATSAFAADLPVRQPIYKAPPPIAPLVRTWTGCYVGAGFGYGMYNQDLSHPTGESGIDLGSDETLTLGGRGWLGTVQGGCDYQFAGSWVIGAFGDFDWESIKGHVFERDERLSRSWAVGGRLGYIALPDLLAYISGGYTQARFDAVTFCDSCNTFIDAHTYKGWFIGSGYEYRLVWFSPNLTLKTEYRFSEFRKDTLDSNFCEGPCGTIDSQKWVQTVRSELVWRFNFWN